MVTSTNVARQVKVDTTTTNCLHDHKHNFPPLVSPFNDKIRPILDAVDKLRSLNITQEGIALPTIVVVGDQSSGKSSVLESLAGISLPRGQEICTRVPLIMRLQHHPDDVPEFVLEYKNETVNIMDESRISEAIDKATVEVAGNYKGIANVPLTLVVKKKGVPDLTMVDLPGITRVPIGDQPDDIYEQISVRFEEDDKDPSIWLLDHNYHEAIFSMFKRINAKEHVVGWYSHFMVVYGRILPFYDSFMVVYCRI